MNISCTSNLSNIFYIVKSIMNIIMIISPILVIISFSIVLIKMTFSPEDKKLIKRLSNTLTALIIIFLIPTFLTIVMYALGDSNDISKCYLNSSKFDSNSTYIDSLAKDRTSIIYNPRDYEKGDSKGSKYCPRSVSRTRTLYHSDTFRADTAFSISARQNFESGNWYTTQAAVYDCQNIIAGQHKSYMLNGVMHKNEGGRVAWFDIKTGKNIWNVSIGNEGTHMARLAYDSDRDVVLVGSESSDKMLQIDNKTKTIMTNPKYASMVGGGSYFIKYDSYNHQLVGLSRNVISYYKYREQDNSYVKTGSITLDSTSKWDPQNFNVDGQVIYIANSNPHWGSSNYAVIVYDMKTGKMLEYHKLDGNVTGGHIEDVIVDIEGNLWLICPAIYWREVNYVANAFSIGP